jgi:peptidoglycan/xylan/chitin deacetylase (PgdA/CDA1 family)
MWERRFARLNRGERTIAWSDGYSGNLSVARALFLEVGGFATDLDGVFDVELVYRLAQAGARLAYLPDALGDHDDYKDFRALAREAERQGRATVAVWQRHPATLSVLLGRYAAPTVRQRALRGLLLAVNAGPALLALLSRFVQGRPWETEWYTFVHQYFYWRGVRSGVADRDTWARLTYQTPIFMYHAFAAPGEPASRFVMPPRALGRQLTALRWLGYRIISLEDYLAARRAHQLPPARSVIVTIDDGYTDTASQALPVFRQHAATATLFVVTGHAGGVNSWDSAGVLRGRSVLDWDGVRAVAAAGLSIGAHPRTHPRLSQLPPEQALAELAGARADLERELGQPVRTLAYPYGDRDAATLALAAEAGFDGACSVRRGPNSLSTPLYELHRIEVFGTDSLLRFILGLWVGDENLPPRRRAQP